MTDPARAEELVGDQLEADPDAGVLRFWMTVCWHVTTFSWRTCLGVVCGGFVGLWSWLPVSLVWERIIKAPPSQEMVWLLGLSMLLWCMTAFSLVRFGIRSEVFRLSAVAALLGSSGATLLQRSGGRPLLLLATAALIGLNLVSRQKREALVTFVVPTASAWVIGFCVLQLQQAVHSPSKWPLILGAVMIPLTEGLVSSHLHDSFCRPRNQTTTSVAI